jgi:hypothetical protein
VCVFLVLVMTAARPSPVSGQTRKARAEKAAKAEHGDAAGYFVEPLGPGLLLSQRATCAASHNTGSGTGPRAWNARGFVEAARVIRG